MEVMGGGDGDGGDGENRDNVDSDGDGKGNVGEDKNVGREKNKIDTIIHCAARVGGIAANIEFPASGGTNNTISHVFIADALTSGNILFVGELDVSKVIADGDIFRINAENLTVELK